MSRAKKVTVDEWLAAREATYEATKRRARDARFWHAASAETLAEAERDLIEAEELLRAAELLVKNMAHRRALGLPVFLPQRRKKKKKSRLTN